MSDVDEASLLQERESWLDAYVASILDWVGEDLSDPVVESVDPRLAPEDLAAAIGIARAVSRLALGEVPEDVRAELSRIIRSPELCQDVVQSLRETMTHRVLDAPEPWGLHTAAEFLTEVWASRCVDHSEEDTRHLLMNVFDVDRDEVIDALMELPQRPLVGYHPLIDLVGSTADRSVRREFERVLNASDLDRRQNHDLSLVSPGMPDHLFTLVNDLAVMKSVRQYSKVTDRAPSEQLSRYLAAPIEAIRSLTAAEFAWMQVLDPSGQVDRILVHSLLAAQPATPDWSQAWHGLYGGTPWWSFPAPSAQEAARYPRTRELGLARDDRSLHLMLVDSDRRPITEALVYDLDDLKHLAELVLLCQARRVGVEGVIGDGDEWFSASAAVIQLEEGFCDALREQLSPSLEWLVNQGSVPSGWNVDRFTEAMGDLQERLESTWIPWRDILASPPAVAPAASAEAGRPPVGVSGPTPPSLSAPDRGTLDVVISQRLRRLWTDVLGPTLEAAELDLGSAWRQCSLERRGKVLFIHAPFDFGTGDALEAIEPDIVEGVTGVTGGHVDQVRVIDASESRFRLPSRRNATAPTDLFHAGDPATVGELQVIADELGRRLTATGDARAVLAEVGVAAASRWRVWLAAPTPEAKRAVGSTPGAAFALHDAVRRWQGVSPPNFDVISDMHLWAESPGIL